MSVPKYIYRFDKNEENRKNVEGLTNIEQLLLSNEALSRENTKIRVVNKNVSKSKLSYICKTVDKEGGCYLVDEDWANKVPEEITFHPPTKKERNTTGIHAYRRRGGWHEHVYGMYLHYALHGLDYGKCIENFGNPIDAVEAMDHYAGKGRLVLRHPNRWKYHKLRCEVAENSNIFRPFIITDTEAKWCVNNDIRWAKTMAERKEFIAA
jgi:hypothetical protein